MTLSDLIPMALEVECPHCQAEPGKECSGPGVVSGVHSRRRELARSEAMERGWFGRVGQVTCPACKAKPGHDCCSPSGRPRRAGFLPLFHDERRGEARTTARKLTRPPGMRGFRLVNP